MICFQLFGGGLENNYLVFSCSENFYIKTNKPHEKLVGSSGFGGGSFLLVGAGGQVLVTVQENDCGGLGWKGEEVVLLVAKKHGHGQDIGHSDTVIFEKLGHDVVGIQ